MALQLDWYQQTLKLLATFPRQMKLLQTFPSPRSIAAYLLPLTCRLHTIKVATAKNKVSEFQVIDYVFSKCLLAPFSLVLYVCTVIVYSNLQETKILIRIIWTKYCIMLSTDQDFCLHKRVGIGLKVDSDALE